MRKFLVTAAIAAFAAVLLVAPAFAGKGGNHNGTGVTPWVAASATSVGGQVNLAGCGYQFAPVTVLVTEPNGQTLSFLVGMWSTGCLDTAYFTATLAGNYTVQVYQGKDSSPSASTSVAVG